MARRQGLRIGAKHVDTKKTLHVINPSSGELLTSVACASENEIDLAVGAASQAMGEKWVVKQSRFTHRLKAFGLLEHNC